MKGGRLDWNSIWMLHQLNLCPSGVRGLMVNSFNAIMSNFILLFDTNLNTSTTIRILHFTKVIFIKFLSQLFFDECYKIVHNFIERTNYESSPLAHNVIYNMYFTGCDFVIFLTNNRHFWHRPSLHIICVICKLNNCYFDDLPARLDWSIIGCTILRRALINLETEKQN